MIIPATPATFEARTLKSAEKPVFASEDHSQIRLTVVFKELEKFGPMPFVACQNDVQEYCRDLHRRALSGEFGTVGPYVAPPPTRTNQSASQ